MTVLSTYVFCWPRALELAKFATFNPPYLPLRLALQLPITIFQFSIFNRAFGLFRAPHPALALILFAAFAPPCARAVEPAQPPLPNRPEQFLIQPKAGVLTDALSLFHLQHRVSILRTLPSSGGLQILSVPPDQSVSSLVAAYQSSGLVDFAEPDYLGHVAATVPNDPKYLDGTLWGLAKISAPDGWDVQTSATNIIVAVLDTGVRYTHEDLAANIWTSPADHSHGLNAIAGSTDPSDDSGHGTLVAGVLGAVGNNGIGVVGVAWNVQIMACKCFDKFGVGDIAACVSCLDYARTNGAKLINASWGFSTNSLALSNALYRVQSDSIIVVAASGNIGSNLDLTSSYPSSYHLDNVVSVAYTTAEDALGPQSNYGATTVHLGAPGDHVYSTFAATDNFYYSQSGSSFAAPYVTGALALILSKFPDEPYQASISRALNGVDSVPALAGKCISGGRLNLRNALAPKTRLFATVSSPTGIPQIRVVSAPGRTCIVQTSTDLQNWSGAATNVTSTLGTFQFTDLLRTNRAPRFYRALDLP
jgi:subtilisin family serine protease